MDERHRSRRGRPERGDIVRPGMSQRDIALALGRSRQWVERCLDLAALPKDEFESLIESEDFSPAKLYYLARLRANKSVLYERTCPHCGQVL